MSAQCWTLLTNNTKEEMSFEIIGYVGRPYGLEGKFFISEARIDAETLGSLKFLYLGEKEEPDDVLEILYAEKQGKRICLQLEGIRTREAAAKRLHQALYLPREQLKSFPTAEKDFPLKGFRVLQDAEELGCITAYMQRAPQDILLLKDSKGKEVMIPFVDAFIEKVDERKKALHVRLPEGMLNED